MTILRPKKLNWLEKKVWKLRLKFAENALDLAMRKIVTPLNFTLKTRCEKDRAVCQTKVDPTIRIRKRLPQLRQLLKYTLGVPVQFQPSQVFKLKPFGSLRPISNKSVGWPPKKKDSIWYKNWTRPKMRSNRKRRRQSRLNRPWYTFDRSWTWFSNFWVTFVRIWLGNESLFSVCSSFWSAFCTCS